MALPRHTESTTPEPRTLLAREFAKRIATLGISRRELTRRVDISRQTIHHIENEGRTDLRPSTFAAIDKGLHWRPGTALALANGDGSALEHSDRLTIEDREDATRWRLVARIYSMELEDLDRLVAHIDGTRPTNGDVKDDELQTMRERMAALEDRIANMHA